MIPDELRRRRLLALSTVALAGCSGAPGGTDTKDNSSGGDGWLGTETATSTPTPQVPQYDTSLSHDETAWAGYDPEWTAPSTAPERSLSVEVLVENLEIPWDLAFAPTGQLFLTERTGRILRYEEGEVVGVTRPHEAIDAGSVEPGATENSWFVDGGEGGTMGLAVHPNYPDVPLLYVYYTADVGDKLVNRLAYYDVSADEPGKHSKTLLETPASNIHNGGRITFGPANYLYVTVGDAGERELAGDPDSLAGSVLRLTAEGEAAPGNESPGDPRIFTMGHRNPQGIGWLPDTTTIVDEHGPGPDELNRLEVGANYGWPEAREPEQYEGTDYHRPLANHPIDGGVWAPSGAVFYQGETLPSLTNRYLVGTLASQQLKLFTLTPPGGEPPPLGETGTRYDADWLDDAYTVTSHDALTNELGRIRHIEQGPDGALYAITSNRDGRANGEFPLERDDVLVRLTQG
ncbi:MAG: PQQ-dependent sugar dehydrogenase [Halolamina sp.]|uniref:PQQ-dependent sugar dehydrogenase n=1 Tax=Halolamina sp. TaxID=1940283 RepID=UPI002FC3BC9B